MSEPTRRQTRFLDLVRRTRKERAAIDLRAKSVEWTLTKNLTRRQRQAHERLIESLCELELYVRDCADTSPNKLDNDDDFKDFTREYESAMVNAIRVGLKDDPLVANWIVTQHGLARRRLLRRARSGVEKGAKRILTHSDIWIATTAWDYWNEPRRECQDLKRAGWEDTRRELRERLVALKASTNEQARFHLGQADIDTLERQLKSSRPGFRKLLCRVMR